MSRERVYTRLEDEIEQQAAIPLTQLRADVCVGFGRAIGVCLWLHLRGFLISAVNIYSAHAPGHSHRHGW